MQGSSVSCDLASVQSSVSDLLKSAFDNGHPVDPTILPHQLTKSLFYGRDMTSCSADSQLEEIQKQGPRQVCQYQFKKNDIVWICRSCQSDETCVLCNDCFQDSQHKGHEVYFYHSQAGGCCDCGDAGAWKPEGFCTKHGHSHPNPISTIPDDVRLCGEVVMEEVISQMVDYCQECADSFNIEALEEEEGRTYSVYVLNDDIHTPIEIRAILAKEDAGVDGVETFLNNKGCVCIKGDQPFMSMCDLAKNLQNSGLQACVVIHDREKRLEAFLACVHWLYKIAQIGDGLCRLVCSSIPIPLIHKIMETDPYLSKDMVVPLHDLFLTLMADQPFKIACSRGYSLALAKVADLYGRGVGASEHCLFGLSVQFLNRYIYVEGMIHEYNYFTTASSSLLKLMQSAKPDFVGSPVLKHRRYNPLLADLKVIFTLPETPRYFCAICMDDILSVFSLVQYVHPQTRAVDSHVEFESRDWMYAFNLYLGFGSLFDYVVNWYESPTAIVPAIEAGVEVPTALHHMRQVARAVFEWQSGIVAPLRWDVVPGAAPGGRHFALYQEPDAKSFHLVLHRFLGTCVREACRYSHMDSTLLSMQSDLTDSANRANLTGLVDFPLLDVVLEAQIRVGMWRRNGQIMLDQIMNYGEPPFCRIFRDLDILLVQFCAPTYGVNRLLSHIIHRFGVFEWLSNKNKGAFSDGSRNQMVEEMVSFLILLVTEIPLPGFESPADRVKIMLRREIVHKLVSGPCTYSELQECMGLVPESEKVKSSVLDSLIEAIGDWQEGTALEPSKLRLKESVWAEYDPSFPHASTKVHQVAMETRPKMKYAQPITPPPPPAHPAFASLRLAMLCDPILLNLLRDLVYSHVSVRCTTSQGYSDVKNNWALQCSTTCFAKVLQLLTLVMHNAFSKEKEPPEVVRHGSEEDLDGELGVLSGEERRAALSQFMLEAPNIVIESNGEDVVVEMPSLIGALMDLHDSLSSGGGDVHTVQWLLWVISKVEELSAECEGVVEQRMSSQLNEKRALEMKERRDRARARAMAAMKKSANAFAAHIEGMSDDDDEEEEDDGDQQVESMECIICRSKEPNDVMGFLGFSQASNFLRLKEPVIHIEDETAPEPPLTDSDLHIQFCGHCMHLGCFDSYFAVVIDRAGHQNALILDTDRGQFQCPFCKKIGNMVVPCVNRGTSARGETGDEFSVSEWTKWTNSGLGSSETSQPPLNESVSGEDSGTGSDDAMSQEEATNTTQGVNLPGAHSFTNAITSFFRRMTAASPSAGAPPSSESSGDERDSELRDGEEAAGEVAGGDSGPRHQRSDEYELEVQQAIWFRFMSTLCEPVLGAEHIFNRLESYKKIPDYLEKSLSAVVFSLYIETLEKGSMYHLQGDGSSGSGINAYKYMREVVKSIRNSLGAWGLRRVLRRNLHLALSGEEPDSSWTEHIAVTAAARSSVSAADLVQIRKGWFALPVLAMPLLHAVVLLVASNELDPIDRSDEQSSFLTSDDIRSEFSVKGADNFEVVATFRWLCTASLVQIIMTEMRAAKQAIGNADSTHHIGRKRQASPRNDSPSGMDDALDPPTQTASSGISNWNMYPFLVKLSEIVGGGPLPAILVSDIMLNVVHKWIAFINVSLHIVTKVQDSLFRVSPELSFPPIPEKVGDLTEACAMPYALAVGMSDIMASDSVQELVLMRTSQWFEAFTAVADSSNLIESVGKATCFSIGEKIPFFVSIPEEYTKLHGYLNSQCDFDYPALCLCCGAILNSGGKGKCSDHVKKCCGEVGVFFLLQDCSLLLLHRQRGSYYASPYVDAHGEKHRSYRGRPLFIDKKRVKMLHKLWLSHAIPREVAQKRSSSTRVIINGHY